MIKLFEKYKIFHNEQKQKLNSPTFAYYTLYRKYPDFAIRGKSDSAKKLYNGIYVDKNLKIEWLNKLNKLPIEIKSTEEGKDNIRISHAAFRLYEPDCYNEQKAKEISNNINKYTNFYSSIDFGMENKWRIMVCGSNWMNKTTIKDWEKWWENLLIVLKKTTIEI